MESKNFIINNELGLHSRLASRFVEITNKFSSDIEIIVDDMIIDGKSIMGILSLGVKESSSILIKIEGKDEKLLMEELINLLE